MRRLATIVVVFALNGSLCAAAEQDALFPVRVGGLVGFIDRRGEIQIEPRFEETRGSKGYPAFAEGLESVRIRERWGYIDTNGTVAIRPQFLASRQFSEGLAAVQVIAEKKRTWGYIDRTGKFVIHPQFESAAPFSQGHAWVGTKDGNRVIDRQGSTLFESPTRGTSWKCDYKEGRACFRGEQGYGFIDATGAVAVEPRFPWPSFFSDGLALVQKEKFRTYYFIDRDGDPAIPGPYSRASDFSEGLAPAYDGAPAFIDRTGRQVFRVSWAASIRPFSDGLAQFEATSFGYPAKGPPLYGYLDRLGQIALPAVYLSADDFRAGLAAVSICGDSGYIDRTGKPIWGLESLTRERPDLAAAPDPSRIRTTTLAKATGHPGPLVFRHQRSDGRCTMLGRSVWEGVVGTADQTFEPITIALLEGGSVINKSQIAAFRYLFKKRRRQEKDLLRKSRKRLRHRDLDSDSFQESWEALNERARARLTHDGGSIFRKVEIADAVTGFAIVEGFGPEATGYGAMATSPDGKFDLYLRVMTGVGSPKKSPEAAAYRHRIHSDGLNLLADVLIATYHELFL